MSAAGTGMARRVRGQLAVAELAARRLVDDFVVLRLDLLGVDAQRLAAAASSIMRAAAPHSRIGFMKCRVLREPSVSWLPNFASSPGACAILTRDQSASSSSARISGMPVRTPCPISERWQTIVTVPSLAIETKMRGSLTVPCGIASAPYFWAACASAARERQDLRGERQPPTAAAPCEEACGG